MNHNPQSEVFQFRKFRFQLTYLVVVAFPLGISVLVSSISTGAPILWLLFFLIFIFLWVIGPYLFIRTDSDIFISNDCIRRIFAGKIIQSLSWDNIEEVRIVRAPTKDHSNRVAINFKPKVIPRRSFTRTGRIVFTTEQLRQGNVSDLINSVNRQIESYGIKVAWWRGGVKTYANHVEWPLPGEGLIYEAKTNKSCQ